MGMEQFNPEPLSLKGIWTWMQQFELYISRSKKSENLQAATSLHMADTEAIKVYKAFKWDKAIHGKVRNPRNNVT